MLIKYRSYYFYILYTYENNKPTWFEWIISRGKNGRWIDATSWPSHAQACQSAREEIDMMIDRNGKWHKKLVTRNQYRRWIGYRNR